MGSNNNIFDIENGILVQNQVQVIATNSAGNIVVETGVSGLTITEATQLAEIDNVRKLMQNRMETNPTTGILTVYDDDNVTILAKHNIKDKNALGISLGSGVPAIREKVAIP